MAGTNPAFSAAKFRDAIRSTMTMGLPNATSERATFRWLRQETFAKRDSGGRPFTWTDVPTSSIVKADVQVPVAVEFSARPAGSLNTVAGEFDASRVIITVLDTDYPLIQGANLVLMGGNTYDIEFVAPPIGLFDVTIYQLYLLARDES